MLTLDEVGDGRTDQFGLLQPHWVFSPPAGASFETTDDALNLAPLRIAPRAGAWIETAQEGAG